MIIHSDDNPYFCENCGKKFRDNHDLKKHERICAQRVGNQYACSICDMKFCQLSSWTAHKKIHDVYYDSDMPIMNPDKGTVPSKQSYKRNSLIASGKVNDKTDEIQVSTNGSVNSDQFFCKPCKKQFRDENDLKRHETTKDHLGEKTSPDMSFVNQNYKRNSSIASGNVNDEIQASTNLTIHIDDYVTTNQFFCKPYKKQFGDKGDLNRHETTKIHLGLSVF